MDAHGTSREAVGHRTMVDAEGPEKCGPRRPTRSGYSCNNAVLWRQTIEGTLRDFWLAQETAAAVVSSEPRLPPPPVRTQSHCPARQPPLALHSNAAALVSRRSPHASTRSRLCQA